MSQNPKVVIFNDFFVKIIIPIIILNIKIIQETLSLYKKLIVVKSIPIVQEVYKNILQDTDISFSTIIKYCSNQNNDFKINDKSLTNKTSFQIKGLKLIHNSVKNAETCLLFNLCVFAELGNAKNNLISMYALTPTLFELLTDKISPANWTLAEYFPNIQYAILNRLYSHSLRYDHFIVSSSLFQNKHGSDMMLTNAPTRDYFKTIIEIIVKILPHSSTTLDISLLCLNWISEIIDHLTIDSSYIFESSLFSTLVHSIITTAYSNEAEISLSCSKILLKILKKFSSLNESVLFRVLDLTKYNLMNLNEKIRTSYSKLLLFIPVNILILKNIDISSLKIQDYSIFTSIARNNYITNSQEPIISVQTFKTLIGYILAGLLNQNDSLYSITWLERIFYSCQRNKIEDKGSGKETTPISTQSTKDLITLDSIVDGQENLLWFWALWECAQFCIFSKLKTPLGKALDTFVAIEQSIKNFYFNILEATDKKDSLSRVNLLVHFVEYLEKLTYNAYEGTAICLQPVNKPIKIFFRTNKPTCNEWFWRVRYYLVSISLRTGHYELAIRHAYEYISYSLQQNLGSTNEFDQIVIMLLKSLIKVGSSQAILGLYQWLNSQNLKKSYDWIKATAQESQGKLEMACEDYKKSFKNVLLNNDSNSISEKPFLLSILKFEQERIFECYFSLHNWNEYLKWREEYKTYIDNDNLKLQLDDKIDINYIKAMSSFELDDFNNVESSLKSFNVETYDELILNKITSIEEIESTTLKEIFTNLMSSKCVNNNLDVRNKLSNSILRILDIDEMSVWNNERLVFSFLSQLCINQVDLPYLKSSFKLDASKINSKYLNHIEMILKSQAKNHNEFRLEIIRVARKQSNFNLASNILISEMNYLSKSTNINNDLIESSKIYLSRLNESNLIINNHSDLKLEKEAAKLIKLLNENNSNKNDLASIEILTTSINRYIQNFLEDIVNNDFSQSLSTSINPYSTFNWQSTVANTQFKNKKQNNLTDITKEFYARSILTLSKWLSLNSIVLKELNSSYLNNNRKISMNISSFSSNYENSEIIINNLNKILSLKSNTNVHSHLSDKFNLKNDDLYSILNNDEIILGDLLDLATAVSPKLCKSWHQLADWCYKWGRKSADKLQLASLTTTTTSTQNNNEDQQFSLIFDLLPPHTSQQEKEFIKNLFSRGLNSINLPEICDNNYDNRDGFSLEEASQLLTTNCSSLTEDIIENILEMWRKIVSRIFYFHQTACKSYFTFLKLSAQNYDDKLNEKNNITSTLRLLKILVKYAVELKTDLQKGLAETPTQPWKDIISQLFCRLNHPETYVRQSVSELLCRIARDFPHLIIYPAVVGAQDGPTKIETVNSSNDKSTNLFDDARKSQTKEGDNVQETEETNEYPDDLDNEENINDNENYEPEQPEGPVVVDKEDDDENENEENDEEEIVDQEKHIELKNTYKYLLDTLSETNPKMIDEVKLFVNEMRRITLLREELWYGTLNQIHSDVSKRMDQLTNELNRLKSNQSLDETQKIKITKEKYEIVLQPIVSILEHVYEITIKYESQTPNEEKFHHEFSKKLLDGLNQLKDINNAFKPQNGWTVFKELHQLFHQRSQRRQSNSLNMEQISPKLAALKSSTIPIPGIDGQFCTIHSIGSTVLILPTKTKPKKLYFMGSNGKKYPYLFKGLEDLHLDERIMQLLSICNAMFAKLNKSDSPSYHALNYSVTPLGPRAGLISWVEGAFPLFTFYKKWQQREAIYIALKQQQQQQQSTQQPSKPPQQPQVLRPNELYYSKLNPYLKEKGLTVKSFNENRNNISQDSYRKVLDELIKETPSDLLSREMWCNSSTPGNWWKVVQVYSRSTAVMSIIGYVIGLGDRHLDNVLVNLNSGQVAHIDYNICFEKGHNLRVPERVPFRMTQNIQHALGLTGVEGVFRSSSENVLKTLRRGRETLLTLLEAFVYDPLLDWTVNDSGIIASFYGGGSKSNESNVSTKEKRKNIEKNMTHRLYSIRLIENSSLIEKNHEIFIQLLNKLESKSISLNDLINKKNSNDDLIRIYEQAKIYLDESITLHNDNNKIKLQNQHPVYSLHERYANYLTYISSLNQLKELVDEKINEFHKISNNHLLAVNFVKNLSENINQKHNEQENQLSLLINSMLNYLFENESKTKLVKLFDDINISSPVDFNLNENIQTPYDIVNEFLSSIGQKNYISQAESLYNKLDEIKINRRDFMITFYNKLQMYSLIYEWLPINYNEKSKHLQLLDWLNQIKLNNIVDSIDIFNNILDQYNTNFDSDFKILFKSNHQCVSTDENQSEKITIEKLENLQHEFVIESKKVNDLKLRKSTNDIQNELMIADLSELVNNTEIKIEEKLKMKHDLIESNLLDFIQNELNICQLNSSPPLLINQLFESFNFAIIQFLNDDLQKWIMMENAAMNAKEQLCSLTSIDGDWFLEEMLSLILNMNNLTSVLRKVDNKFNNFNHSVEFQKCLEACDSLLSLYTNLKLILFNYNNTYFESSIQYTFKDINDADFILNQLDTTKFDKFYALISSESLQIETISNVSIH